MPFPGETVVDVSDVLRGLNDLQKAGDDLTPVWRGVRKDISRDLRTKQSGPDGAWEPYAPSTKKRLLDARGGRKKGRRNRGQPTKRGAARVNNMLGRLKSRWQFFLRPHKLSVISVFGKVADYHQEGIGGRLPARPFAWLNDNIMQSVAESTLDHLESSWTRSRSFRRARGL